MSDQKTNKWISVKERLPDIGDLCQKGFLVCLLDLEGRARIRFAWRKKKIHRKVESNESIKKVKKESSICSWWMPGISTKNITHWMPLPAFPNQEICRHKEDGDVFCKN
jgi:hypothetical protein